MSRSNISVIIPVYNGERFLEAAISSVLGQANTMLELILVDDGSTDGTPQIAARMGNRVKYVRQDNQGPPAARNHGLRLACGDIIGFLDADDVWMPRKLDLQLSILQQNTQCDIVWGRTQIAMPAGPIERSVSFASYGDPAYYASLAACLFRRRAFDRLGNFNIAQRHGDDLDFFARAKEAGLNIHRHVDTVLEYRRHDKNITNDVALDAKYLVGAVKRSLDRKRKPDTRYIPTPR